MQLISREAAKAAGIRFFYTGIECTRGHVAQRNVSDGKCYECLKISWERVRRRKGKKPFEPNVARREAAAKGEPTFIGKPCKHGHGNVRWTHNCACKECTDTSAKNHPKRLEYARAWKARNPHLYSQMMRATKAGIRAACRGAEGHYKAADIQRLFSQQSGQCTYCRADLSLGYHVDHMTPLSRGGSNFPSNIQLLCSRCNISKGAKTDEEYRPLADGREWIDGRATVEGIPS